MSPKKTVNVMVRMTPEEAEQLDRVGGIEPAVRGRSAAVRRLLRASMVPGGTVPVEATSDPVAEEESGREARVPVGVDDARALRDVVLETRDEVRATLVDLERQIRPQGHLLNQIARACNTAARRGVATGFDAAMIAALVKEQAKLASSAVDVAGRLDETMSDLERKTRR
ncbi:MAG: hypothetical protein L0J57_11430 [Brachybacterium sp.]|nr:hypothetical protein [Brachybacterium sp.]